MRKPDGLVVVAPGGEAAFLAPLPVRRLWGVGPKMEESLLRLGIHTIGDLARTETAALERKLGSHAGFLQDLARGIDDRAGGGARRDAAQEHRTGAHLRRGHRGPRDAAPHPARDRGRGGPARARARPEGAHDHPQVPRRALRHRDAGPHRRRSHRRRRRRLCRGVAPLRGRARRAARAAAGDLRVRLRARRSSGCSAPRASVERDRVRDAVDERFGEGALTRASLLPAPGVQGV